MSGLVESSADARSKTIGQNYRCRAWVNFDGIGSISIHGSGNVSSVTDNGTGDFTVNFATAMEDNDYACLITSVNRSASSAKGYTIGYYSTDSVNAVGYNTSSIRLTAKYADAATPFDLDPFSVAIFR